MYEPLSLWNNTPVRQLILDFVFAVTTQGGPDFIPPVERIVTFDNDGTLWCEKPFVNQLFFGIQRCKELAIANPSLLEQPNYKAAAADDLSYFSSLYTRDPAEWEKLVNDTHIGMTRSEFEDQVATFLTSGIHPRFGVPFKQLTYAPMVELIRYLEVQDFKVFITTAGGMTFVRPVSEEIYGVPRERVFGCNETFETRLTDHGPVVYRKAKQFDLVDGPSKPVNIEVHIGRIPILVAGNADGDLHMLWYSETSPHKSLQLLLHHDDADREYAYNGGAEKVLQLAANHNWHVISMKKDFLKVFS
jgi:phosphoserine phosphatase